MKTFLTELVGLALCIGLAGCCDKDKPAGTACQYKEGQYVTIKLTGMRGQIDRVHKLSCNYDVQYTDSIGVIHDRGFGESELDLEKK